MGCACRGGTRVPSRSVVAPVVSSTSSKSVCAVLESDGNNTTVRIENDGRLYLGTPFSTNLPAASSVSSMGCRGPFSQAVLAASLKLTSIYLSPTSKARFQSLLPYSSVKLGFLREVLRSF